MVIVDALAGLLDGPRAHRAFLVRLLMGSPWSVWVDDRAALSLVAVLRGEAWVTIPGESPARLQAGDIALIRGPEPYTVSDPSARPPDITVLPGGMCTTADGESLVDRFGRGVRTWGNDPDGAFEALVGTYERVSELGERLLAALPRLAVVPADSLDSPLLGVLTHEIDRDRPGQQTVLDRSLDLLVVSAVRAWLEGNAPGPGWFTASDDPVVGPALRLLDGQPAEPWTLPALAASVGCSRATLARRFTELVGEPPITYLTERRMSLAADLLLEPGASVTSVSRRVGYATPYAFSTAFKRVRGRTPDDHRRNGGTVV